MQSLDDVLASKSSSAKLRSALAAGRVFAAFCRIVGPQMSAHWRPVRLDGSRLLIACSGPAFKHELLYRQSKILSELASQVPQVPVTELSGFVSSKVQTTQAPPASEYPSISPPCGLEEAELRAERIVSSVKDPALRAVFKSLLTSALQQRVRTESYP